jgi:diguanylate cyclase (GGDEF)-like protein
MPASIRVRAQDGQSARRFHSDGRRVIDILIGGLSRSMAATIEQHIDGVTVHVADTGGQVLEWLASRTCGLLVLDHDLPGVGAPDIVRRLTEGEASARIPVVYCMDRDADRAGVRARIERFGVSSFLSQPFGSADLLETLAALVTAARTSPVPAGVGVGTEPTDATSTFDAPAGIRPAPALATPETHAFGSAVSRRLDALDSVAVALLDGSADPARLDDAHHQAGQLAEVLAAFGRHQAASLAREVEHVIDARAAGGTVDTLRLSELVVRLRAELDRPLASAEPGGLAESRPLLAVLDSGSGMGDNVALEAQARGLRFRIADDARALRAILDREPPAVVLIDLDTSPVRTEGLALIGEIEARLPMTPVLVATSAGSLANRVAIARAGGYAMLRKPVSSTGALDAVMAAIRRSHVSGCRVLAVDDDALSLATLRDGLPPLGVDLTVLDDARRFWEEIEVVRPDVVLLGMNTRHHSGLELCRVLRGDERWIATPVLILGDDSGPAAMHLASLAGADDFIAKPVVTRDLVTRLANRLERHRVVHEAAGTDPLTGIPMRQRVEPSIETLMRLAMRYRQPFAVAAINVDGLREVNESYGYAAGDTVLRRLARMLQNSFRSEDVVGRWGGDQLILGAFGLDKDDCVRRLRAIGDRLSREPFRGGDAELGVAFSAGVSGLFADGIDVPALLHAAEDTLALAKSLGRGWVLPSGWSPDRRSPTEVVDIVLVDDDTALAGLLMHALEQVGWSIRWFRNAADATGQLCGPWPELRARALLLEIELPGRDGFSVLRALSRDDVLGRTRVIMLTARANEPEILKAFDLGAFDHVAKPFSVQVLIQRIRRAIQVVS